MRKSVRNRTITNEEFSTVLVEIEGVLNSRPLTFVYEDDIEEPLTPIHLYRGYKILNPITWEGYKKDPDFNIKRDQALSRNHQFK